MPALGAMIGYLVGLFVSFTLGMIFWYDAPLYAVAPIMLGSVVSGTLLGVLIGSRL